jgi:hypothetical protein
MVEMRGPRVEVDDVDKSVPESDYWLELYSSNLPTWLMINLWVKKVNIKPPIILAGDGAVKTTSPW